MVKPALAYLDVIRQVHERHPEVPLVAYNVSGDKGVELTLADGRKVMIGSQKAEELALAILNAQEIRF